MIHIIMFSDYTDVPKFPFSSDKLEKLLVAPTLSWKIQGWKKVQQDLLEKFSV